VGLAYLLVEVWMLNRFSMYLGHQTYGLSVVLSTLLVSSGFGAWLSGRLLPDFRRRALIGCGLIVLLLVAGMFLLSDVIETTWHWHRIPRVLLTGALVATAGLAMGIPFVAGLNWIQRTYPTTVPWCIGINGFASVLATVLVIPLALWFGYPTILTVGIGLYALAFVVAVSMRAVRS
jgi:hypothetical protein